MDEAKHASLIERGATYYDRQEVRNPAEREASMFHALPGLLQHALDNAPLLAERLGGIEPDSITSRSALASLPILPRHELRAWQRARPPFAGLTATPVGRLARILAAPGPVYQPEGPRTDYWRFARAMYAAGLRSGAIVHNAFSYHLEAAGMMVESGARALGCPVIAAGTAPFELQAEVLADLRPTAYAGPWAHFVRLLGATAGADGGTRSLTTALIMDEVPAARRVPPLPDGFAIGVYRAYATPDLGLIAYETESHDGLVVDEAMIVEIVRPGTGTPVPDGEVGEVVVTAFNPDYPLIRLATGDLSAVVPGTGGCGRTNMRLRGLLGPVEVIDDPPRPT